MGGSDVSEGKTVFTLKERVERAVRQDRARSTEDLALFADALVELESLRKKVGKSYYLYGESVYNQLLDVERTTSEVTAALQQELAAGLPFKEEPILPPFTTDPPKDLIDSLLTPTEGESDGSEGNAGSDSLEQEGGGEGSDSLQLSGSEAGEEEPVPF